MIHLTKAEEQIMQFLWKLEKATAREVLEQFEQPRPAYNTVSTIIRILEKKGFIGHEGEGKTYTYYPLLAQASYKKESLKTLISSYFEGSFSKMASFFAKEEELSTEDIAELKNLLKNEKK